MSEARSVLSSGDAVVTRPSASARFSPELAAVRSARRLVMEAVDATTCAELGQDAGLITSELAANAVIHARTGFVVRLREVPDGVRVEVQDGSATLPLSGTLESTAMSGRGLPLVHALATRWGVEPLGPAGKVVWAEVTTRPVVDLDDATAEELLELWADLDDAAAPPSPSRPTERSPSRAQGTVAVVVADLPVQELLASKAHVEDLIRELQLVLHDAASRGDGDDGTGPELHVARRLDAAVRDFEQARLQVRGQALRAAARGADEVTLELALPVSAADAAARYRDVLEEAEQLGVCGALLGDTGATARHLELRRRYLGEIIQQLRRASA